MTMAITFTKGTIRRLYPRDNGCWFQLTDATGSPITAPDKNGFHLVLSHPNYNAIYSLLLLAAANRYVITVRTESTRSQPEEIDYITVDW
jgi:hypothetical protein